MLANNDNQAMHDIELKFAQFLADRGRVLAFVCIVSVIVPIYFLRNVRIDNSTEVWLGSDSPEYKQYQRFLDKYGNEEFIAVAGKADDPLDEASLAFQKKLTDRLNEIEQVDRVFDLATVGELLSPFRKDWKELLRKNEMFRNLLIGQDGRTFGLFVYLKRMDDPVLRNATVEEIQTVVARASEGSQEMHLAGTALMDLALDRGSRKASRQFLPVAALLSVLFLTLILRSFGAVVSVLASLGVTTLWTMGLLVAFDKTINMITVAIPSLLFVLAISGGIHITSRFLAILPASLDRKIAIRDALAEVMRPVFLSNVTTAVGFAALTVSPMQPVVEFGLFTALGILLSFIFNITIIPGILCSLHRTVVQERLATPHWTAAIGRSMVRHKRIVLILGGMAFTLSVLLTLKARVESNVLKFFPSTSKIRRDYQFIGNRLTGFYTVELDASIDASEGSTLLKGLATLGDLIAERPEVAKVINYRIIATCFDEIPKPALMPSQSVRKNPLRTMLRSYRYREGGPLSLRLSILVRAMSSKDFYALVNFIEDNAKKTIPSNANYYLTGIATLTNDAQKSLIDTQIRSLTIASITILVLIGLFLRSFRAFIAAILPNLLPIIAVFAMMTLFHIAFDAATVMIASVAIGIAADDTIHFLSHFRTEKLSGLDTMTAVDNSLIKAGRAITYTSIVAAVGFIVLLRAEFQPIRYFGAFTAATMIFAWMGDVFILPACVSLLGLFDSKPSNEIVITKDESI